MNRSRAVIIIFVFVISIANAAGAATPVNNARRIDSARSPSTPVVNMQKIDNTVSGELNIIDGNMGAIYQAMFSLLKEGHETRKIEGEAIRLAGEQKLRNALAAAGAKQLEIEQKIHAAQNEWAAIMATAMASCNAVVSGVATTGNSINTLYDMPNDQRLQNFTSNADALKKNMAILNRSVTGLRNLLMSGKFDKVPKGDPEKLRSNLDNCLRQLHDIKNSTSERQKRSKGR